MAVFTFCKSKPLALLISKITSVVRFREQDPEQDQTLPESERSLA